VALSGVAKGHAMKLPRREFLHLAAGAAAFPAVSRFAWAQAYPTRPVRMIVPFPAGGSTDVVARLMSQWLSVRLAQPFLVENRTGFTGNIGTEAVVHAPADGYTLLLATTTNVVNAAVYDKLNFNFTRDIVPVAGVMNTSHVMVVHPSVPARTISEFIAYARANPAKISMASAGNGSQNHVAGEVFKMRTGVNMVHVPYRGGAPAVADLVGGQVQVMFAVMLEALEYIRAGKLRALAVTTAARSELLPDSPTVADFLPGFEASFWIGIGAPKNTPAEIVDKLNKEINAGLADPGIRTRLADLGGTALPGSPAEFGKFIADETEKWGKMARAANIKVS
jgi:tripartite-type tricarboxylate transporter receptor subunit TctC